MALRVEPFNVAPCMDLCEASQNFNCCSIDFRPVDGQCHLSTETSLSVGDGHFVVPCPSDGFLFAERNATGKRSLYTSTHIQQAASNLPNIPFLDDSKVRFLSVLSSQVVI